MSNINVNELKKLSKEIKGNVTKIKIDGLSKEVEIKKYLPVLNKIELATKVYYNSVDIESEEKGLLAIDKNSEEISLVNNIIKYYTNIELPESEVESFDLLISTGIYETVINNMVEEFDLLIEILENIKEEKMELHRQKGEFSNVLRGIPATIESATKALKNFNPKDFPMILEFMKLNGFNGVEADGNQNV